MSFLPPPYLLPVWESWSLLHATVLIAAGIVPPVLYLRCRSGRPLPVRIIVLLMMVGLLFLILGCVDVYRCELQRAADPSSHPESMWISVRFLGFMGLVSSTIATHVMWIYLRSRDRSSKLP